MAQVKEVAMSAQTASKSNERQFTELKIRKGVYNGQGFVKRGNCTSTPTAIKSVVDARSASKQSNYLRITNVLQPRD